MHLYEYICYINLKKNKYIYYNKQLYYLYNIEYLLLTEELKSYAYEQIQIESLLFLLFSDASCIKLKM